MYPRFLKHLRDSGLLRAGDRLGVAVSGGADSVTLLRLLYEARSDLGLVLSVVHFHHGIRGDEADADEKFVRELAGSLKLEAHVGSGSARSRSQQHSQSLETAARELRYTYFRELLSKGVLDKIATAHTLDDQAETVLMRTLRGAGTRGTAGIHPSQDDGRIIRPLLAFRRTDIESYLKEIGQPWREDSTNRDTHHTRNKIRHELMPLLAKDYNPNIAETLARVAEVSRDEEAYWQAEIAKLLPFVVTTGKPVRGGGRSHSTGSKQIAVNLEALAKQPLALQRRLLKAAAESAGAEADLQHVEELLRAAHGTIPRCELPGGMVAERTHRELQFTERAPKANERAQYHYPLAVPGEVQVAEINTVVRARVEPLASGAASYNPATHPQADTIVLPATPQLEVRNWRDGDRFRQAHSSGEKKVKDILQSLNVPADARRIWPVVESAGQIIWVKDARPRPIILQQGKQVIIEAQSL